MTKKNSTAKKKADEPGGDFVEDVVAPGPTLAPERDDAPATRRLWEIREDVQSLASFLADHGGEITDDEAGEAIDAWLSQVETEEREKLDAYGHTIGQFEARAHLLEAEAAEYLAIAERLKNRAAAATTEAKRLKEGLVRHLEATGRKSIETERFKFTAVIPGGKPKIRYLVPEEQLPERLTVATLTITATKHQREIYERISETLIGFAGSASLAEAKKPDARLVQDAIEAAQAAAAAREREIETLMESLGMEREEAEAQVPRSSTEAILDLATYEEKKPRLKIT